MTSSRLFLAFLFLASNIPVSRADDTQTKASDTVAPADRVAINAKCSDEADRLHLHGNERREYRTKCKMRIAQEPKNIDKNTEIIGNKSTESASANSLEDTCKKYVRNRFEITSKDVYGKETRYTMPSEFPITYGASKNSFFNNHRYVPFGAVIDKYENGQLRGRQTIPFKFCVFDDNADILALDTTLK